MKKTTLYRTVLSASLMALGFVLPFFTGNIPEIGNMLLPMHLPVLLCGLACGPIYGGVIGFALPLLRSLFLSRPVLYPNAIAMAFELAAYGLFIGIFYFLLVKKAKLPTYPSALISLLIAMIAGRAVWGVAQVLLLLGSQKSFTFAIFLANGFLNAIPGIVLQIILIPALMLILTKSKLTGSYLPYSEK